MSHVQAILLDKSKFTISEANKFIKEHNFKPIKGVHETNKFYRYRLRKPNGKIYNYKLKKINSRITLIIEFKKSND